ncbi:Glucose-6-phosphate isomerase [Ancylobacter novellus DSM 506]|uniref:Glucose-6-phosphate isomerase n=1 Tax=Ancylobacter novellus (strain ATCC 8093 / DSM 506 / JCM 20403 / CCM 1077 / IAM 12100 / NBRC 12443 / NCIMB 10456) TaxID=639283 RepID=D7A284_ANCN5|nr:glucose-6-phosphate isomerase [Ancylobacter novellus]ADH89547.1 Glucose-6-phosphate isomerase [Ancylobacter novellus DSM 506]
MSAAVEDVFKALAADRAARAEEKVPDLFAADSGRFAAFSASFEDLLLDFSKCSLTPATLGLLIDLARAAGVEGKRAAMFAGEHINITEDRAVLHTALRDRSASPFTVDGQDVRADVADVLARMGAFAEGIRTGALKGWTGKPITDIVNIGIGGSDLGPVMATIALGPYHHGPRAHYVSNVDGAHLYDTIAELDPASTLFIVASKTFTTQETMANAASAREWIVEALGEAAVANHFAAVSTALDKVSAFGIAPGRVFGFWDWVGGRYSVWSAIGLPVMIAVGAENFGRFLDGGHAMDEHFRSTPLEKNLPVLLGLVGIWHREICGYATRAVIPYDQHLARLPAYLQQLDMESNGKHVTLDGKTVAHDTGPVVWGEPGTNGQHAFFQLIHQGTSPIPVEFLIAAHGHGEEKVAGLKRQHAMLIANCLAQSEALMRGRTLEEAKAQLIAAGRDEETAERIAPHRVFTGSRPSVTVAYEKLDPYTLGRLIALYEHRVFVEGAIWNINSFDQWGVELGKELANTLLPAVESGVAPASLSTSAAGLLHHLVRK